MANRIFKSPYLSRNTQSRGRVVLLNGRDLQDGKKLVVCRHLAVDYVKSENYNYAGFEQFDKFLDINNDTGYPPLNISADEQVVNNYRNNADELTLHQNAFGRQLKGRFDLLLAGKTGDAKNVRSKGGTTKRILWERFTLEMGDHTLGCQVAIKPGQISDGVVGDPYFTVTVFDPNFTNRPLRATYESLEDVQGIKLEDFFVKDSSSAKDTLKKSWVDYNKSTPDIIKLLTKPIKDDVGKKSEYRAEGMRLKNLPQFAFHLMTSNNSTGYLHFISVLLKLPDSIQKLIDWKGIVLAKSGNGTPGLFLALQDGHSEAIKAFGELLKDERLTPDDLKEILLNGASALHEALQNGHSEAIKAFCKFLKEAHISQDDKVSIVQVCTSLIPINLQQQFHQHLEAVGLILKQPTNKIFNIEKQTRRCDESFLNKKRESDFELISPKKGGDTVGLTKAKNSPAP